MTKSPIHDQIFSESEAEYLDNGGSLCSQPTNHIAGMSKDLRTFKEWSDLGFWIRRGSKSVSRNKDGIPVFSEDQVYNVSDCNGEPYDEHEETLMRMALGEWGDG